MRCEPVQYLSATQAFFIRSERAVCLLFLLKYFTRSPHARREFIETSSPTLCADRDVRFVVRISFHTQTWFLLYVSLLARRRLFLLVSSCCFCKRVLFASLLMQRRVPESSGLSFLLFLLRVVVSSFCWSFPSAVAAASLFVHFLWTGRKMHRPAWDDFLSSPSLSSSSSDFLLPLSYRLLTRADLQRRTHTIEEASPHNDE